MSRHIWTIKKLSNSEYHVLEYAHGLHTDTPYVLAKCTGPVPAGDILNAMYVKQEMDNNAHVIAMAAEHIGKCAKDFKGITDRYKHDAEFKHAQEEWEKGNK